MASLQVFLDYIRSKKSLLVCQYTCEVKHQHHPVKINTSNKYIMQRQRPRASRDLRKN